MDTAEKSAAFYPVDSHGNTRMAIDMDMLAKNIRTNIANDWPRFVDLDEYGHAKNRPLAIVAGGPSLSKTIGEVKNFPDVMVCGSAHDYVVKSGITPLYSAACDPGDGLETIRYMSLLPRSTIYLMASSCCPVVFDHLSGLPVAMWHSYGGVPDDTFNGELAIMGGCTVTLRAINLAITLGYRDLHFFGLDSNFAETGEQHAYESSNFGDLIKVRVGGPNGREFITNPGYLAQAMHFQEMVGNFGNYFTPVVHGDGMIAEIMNVARLACRQAA